jgi:hypothetical protein
VSNLLFIAERDKGCRRDEASSIPEMNATLRGGINNNGCNYASTKDGDLGSMEGMTGE